MDIKSVKDTGAGEFITNDGWTPNPKYNPPDGWVEAREDTLALIREERRKQFIKWGLQKHGLGTWLKILVEEVGEVSIDMLKLEFGKESDPIKLDAQMGRLRDELIQVAAVAAAVAQEIDSGSA